ncbi:MAG: type IV secretion protein Rhs [Propionivibrio sp.]|uniref:phage baseplate assembly protein V n=1 Tax=Propionivibrio sp. TaxID=2212460 RepID=UPI001A392B23|nr:phage baseplate assembly protein V [Propionivibrio sp.]MBL8414996.1 type IV secretion protein Rhs [Propionivibrio sp.]
MPHARPALPKALLFGVYSGIVIDVKDPDAQGRVKVSLPWAEGGNAGRYETWARLAVPMAGNNRGTWLIPDVDDEILVAFVAGDPRCPIVIGSLWNGRDAPPQSMDGAGNNDLKVIRSRNGVTITLDDQGGAERFQVETPGGQKIVLQDGPGEVTIEDSNGNSIKLTTSNIKIAASAGVDVTAGMVKVSAGRVEIDAGMAKFSGVVECDTLIANSVVASSYTPGAGNIW